MTTRVSEGAALLVAGYAAHNGPHQVHSLGRIAEALLATAAPWRIQRLSDAPGERYAPSRASLKRHIDELTQATVGSAVMVLTGRVTALAGEPALVTGPLHDRYPEEATLPLAWIGGRLRATHASRLIVAMAASGDGQPDSWLRALATGASGHVIAVHAAPEGAPLVDSLLSAICGDALDPGTGTVTPRSLTSYLKRVLPGVALQGSHDPETLTSVPPLGDMRLSRGPIEGGRPPRASDNGEDMIGGVLPGQFRIERELARGSFGVVYRARQLSVDRDVAVKVLRHDIDASSEDGKLFVHEIQSVGRIDHTNVVRIYQADVTSDGRLFFAMELLVGRDLQQILDGEGTLEPRHATELAAQLLAGLGAVHAAGLVHADVKPANAFVVHAGERERLVLLDFGLARLKPAGAAAESAGGTPAYMAPEQLHSGRVDARSDLFSAALVLVTMLTGWRRRRGADVVPPLDEVPDGPIRSALKRALSVDPRERYQTAADFAAALLGQTESAEAPLPAQAPFRHLAPFTERDRARLHGRERDIAALSELVLFRRAVVYTAPSGVGKTSLLRAGLVPRLEDLGIRVIYHAFRAASASTLPAIIWPGSRSIAEAIAGSQRQRGPKLVLVLDQLEAAVSADEGADFIAELLAFDRLPIETDICVVLSIREDFLARLMPIAQKLEEGISIVRLGPLDLEGARSAIVGPLAEQRLSIAPDLLAVLLADLQAAAAAIGVEMGWTQKAAVYPPHLQLACSILYESVDGAAAILDLAHYRQLGGLETIVGEHLDRVLDTELDASSAAVARELFLSLVTSTQTRAFRTESDLIESVGGRHGAESVRAVLEVLRSRALLVRVRPMTGAAGWELVHDSLVPRVLAWIDRQDLARRRAVELVRYHVRRSRVDVPSLLSAAELRELRDHRDAIAELDAGWVARGELGGWSPSRLVARSRMVRRRQLGALAATAFAILAGGTAVAYDRQREATLRDRDLGRFVIELRPFDWDPAKRVAVDVPIDELPGLRFTLHEPASEEENEAGPPIEQRLARREGPTVAADRMSLRERVEARGGRAILLATGRGRPGEICPPSLVPLRRIPGYASRAHAEPVLVIRVPTCRASSSDTIVVPAGPYLSGGVGDPPSSLRTYSPAFAVERAIDMPMFRIDRVETTNAAFHVFAEMSALTGIGMPTYPPSPGLEAAAASDSPVSGITWFEARAFCRFRGGDLPSSGQWEKSMRGGLRLADGAVNPRPWRNFPWGRTLEGIDAHVNDVGPRGTARVGASPGDRSPYGVLDLAGNVTEWTSSLPPRMAAGEGFRTVRGGDFAECSTATLADFMAVENPRPVGTRAFNVGARCVTTGL